MTPNQISELLVLAKTAAEGVMRVYEAASTDDSAAMVSRKDDGSPLTQADLLSHRIIVDGLKRIAPTIPVVSEEDEHSMAHRTPEGRFWLIDPLDGTKEFISRNGEFTINIALIENGKPVFGIVLAPCLKRLYWGGHEIGAFREVDGVVETLALIDHQENANALRVVASRSHLNEETANFVEQLGACELVQAGSSLKFCLVAEGSADVYPRLSPTSEWDTAAAQAIVEGAGGRVCAMDGTNLCYGKADVLNPHFVVVGKRAMDKAPEQAK